MIKRVDGAWEKRTGHFSGDQSWEYTSSGMSRPNRDSEMSPCGKFQFPAAYNGMSRHTSCPTGPLTCILAACLNTKVYGKGQQTSSKWPDSKFGGSFAGHGICLDYPTLPLEYEMNHRQYANKCVGESVSVLSGEPQYHDDHSRND